MTTIEKLNVMLAAPGSTSIVAYRTWIKEILKEQEKYKWHDLRKNPDDLPEKYIEVLVTDGGSYEIWSLSDIGGSEEIVWADEYGNYLDVDEAIAWREIEAFEEEE